jgi:uncharacterized membrane protein
MIKLKSAILPKVGFYIIPLILSGIATGLIQSAEKNASVIHAVLFASPTCPHCKYVKEEVLPPLMSQYGTKLQIATISIATESGHDLFMAASIKHGNVRLSVPMLIIGKTALIGSDDIPQKFPGLIEKHLAAGGVDWPNLEGLSAMLASKSADGSSTETQPAESSGASTVSIAGGVSPSIKAADSESAIDKNKAPEPSKPAAAAALKPAPASMSDVSKRSVAEPAGKNTSIPETPPVSVPASSPAEAASIPSAVQLAPSGIIDLTAGEAEMGIAQRIKRDIYGNGLAILILIGMVLTLAASPIILKRLSMPATPDIRPRYDWVIPILALIGMGVAAYLSNIEVRHVEAVCGPVGDCNAVNQSKYAKLFGILPIGVLGLCGFIAILTAWMLRRWASGKTQYYAAIGILGMTAFGMIFSIYLTFLEPFVIGATCLWCLSSAVIMTALFILALKPGRQAWAVLFP